MSSPTQKQTIKRPCFDLQTTISIANRIRERCSDKEVSEETLAVNILKHASTKSGSYRMTKSALIYFGLLIKINKNYKLSSIYWHYIKETSGHAKYTWLNKMFNSPTLYVDIQKWFPDLTVLNKSLLTDAILSNIQNSGLDRNKAMDIATIFLKSAEFLMLNKPSGDFIPNQTSTSRLQSSIEHTKFSYPLADENQIISVILTDRIENLKKESLEEAIAYLGLIQKKFSMRLAKL